jgi:hypothetical protein
MPLNAAFVILTQFILYLLPQPVTIMFKPSTLKIVSYIALVCSVLGVLLAIAERAAVNSWTIYLTMISWGLLIYSSYLGTKLSTYELYDEDRKKLGYYIYGILVLFVLFLLFNLSLGILAAIFLAISLHNQKTGFDKWMKEKKSTDI